MWSIVIAVFAVCAVACLIVGAGLSSRPLSKVDRKCADIDQALDAEVLRAKVRQLARDSEADTNGADASPSPADGAGEPVPDESTHAPQVTQADVHLPAPRTPASSEQQQRTTSS